MTLASQLCILWRQYNNNLLEKSWQLTKVPWCSAATYLILLYDKEQQSRTWLQPRKQMKWECQLILCLHVIWKHVFSEIFALINNQSFLFPLTFVMLWCSLLVDTSIMRGHSGCHVSFSSLEATKSIFCEASFSQITTNTHIQCTSYLLLYPATHKAAPSAQSHSCHSCLCDVNAKKCVCKRGGTAKIAPVSFTFCMICDSNGRW